MKTRTIKTATHNFIADLKNAAADDKAFDNFCTKCRTAALKIEKAELRILQAEGKLIRMKTEAIKAGYWLPSASAPLLRSI